MDRSGDRGLLSIRELRVRGDRGNLALDGVTLEIAPGEIVGLAGVSGNGQRELAEALNGLRRPESGSITLDGVELAGSIGEPHHRRRHGLHP